MPHRADQVIPFEQAEITSEGYRAFECSVYAFQMADTITATFTYIENGTEKR